MVGKMHTLLPVILSGGVGARLWPVSRAMHPKPFITLSDGQSLISKTFMRAAQLPHVSQILTVTNESLFFKSNETYQSIKNTLSHSVETPFLLEPFGRNTAPAIALAALFAKKNSGKEAILLILSADHLIGDQAAFEASVSAAVAAAKTHHLVTFGVTPTRPETGFGYIKRGDVLDKSEQTFSVSGFVEKPNIATAEKYVASQDYFWNAGIFCFYAETFLAELQQYAPELLQAASIAFDHATESVMQDTPTYAFNASDFEKLSDISVDYAVLEKSQHVAMVAAQFEWRDIGSWDAMSQTMASDGQSNTVVGDALLFDTARTHIQGESKRLLVTMGIDNLMIIDTPDALLIAHRSRAQDVKQVFEKLKSVDHETHKFHQTVFRPWGSYTVLEEGPGFKIKRIEVRAKASLSLQSHQKRSEHWVVVQGTATIINGDKQLTLQENESTFIPATHTHRLSNPGTETLVIIEVQTGAYLGEDDIQRMDDVYGRIKK